ncbi:MAG: hypothetical protein V2A79_13700 [Planctomycetota bacterium]
MLGVAFAWACSRDARLADAKLKDPVVADVNVAGLTLDRNATPEMVTFALLKAVKADVEARTDLAAREKAFDQQFQLAAPSAIHRQHIRAIVPEHAELKESVYKTVQTWAPTLGQYVSSFDFTFEDAQDRKRMRVKAGKELPEPERIGPDPSAETQVLLEAQDPGGDPNASVVVKIRLAREEGRWRVWWVGFDRTRRHLPPAKPTGARDTPPETG